MSTSGSQPMKQFTCSQCGKVHDDWPALTFDAPAAYFALPENLKKGIGELTSDFCIIRHPEQTDRFIRASLSIKLNDHCESLEYGLWVSLSEKSFQDYADNYGNPEQQAGYFGWIANLIPEYENQKEYIPADVYTRKEGLRPVIVPHHNFDHQLVRDYYEGIAKTEAENRIQAMFDVISNSDNNIKVKKPWWKLW